MRSPIIAPSPVASRTTQRVDVGFVGAFFFRPNTVAAQVGETITFDIADPSYTVTESSGFESPCFQPVGRSFSSNTGDATFDLTVNDTEPIYIMCTRYCALGMVMIINPENSTDIDSFVAAAEGHSLSGQTSESSINTVGATATHNGSATGSTSATATGAAPTNTVSPASHRNIILGGVLGGSTLLACALAIAFIIRHRIRKRATLGQPRALRPPSAGVPARERNALKEKGQAAEPSSDARIDESGQGDSGTDARLQAALEALAALQTEVQELRQADTAETLPEYESRDGQ